MDAIRNNNRINFTAQIKFAEGICERGNKTLLRAANEFAINTRNNNDILHMWEDSGVYKFDFVRKNGLSPTTQYVGKDVLGYLFMEKGWKGIAEFFETTLKAVQARYKHSTGDALRDNINANIDAIMVYIKDKAIGEKIKTVFEHRFVDYDKAGACLHVE